MIVEFSAIEIMAEVVNTCRSRSHADALEWEPMRRRFFVAAVLAVAVLAAIAWMTRREPSNENAKRAESPDAPAVRTLAAPGELALAVQVKPVEEVAAADVRAMSSTFRNSSLLIAIRYAGFYCDEVVAANETVDGVWLASCMDRSGYALSVRAANQFDVRPIAHYFDSLFPVYPPARDNERPFDRGFPLDRLPPEPLNPDRLR